MSRPRPRYESPTNRARRQAKDPFVARLMMLAAGVIVVAPVAYLLRTGGNSGVSNGQLPGAVAVVEAGTESSGNDDSSGLNPATDQPVELAPAAVPASPAVVDIGVVATTNPLAGQPAPTLPPNTTAAPVTSAKKSTTVDIFSCPKSYVVEAGDYWLAIAKKHAVSLDALLTQNAATTEQPLYPGRTLCLPADAKDPTTTVAPATSSAPTAKKKTPATDPPAAAPETTAKQKPTTTQAPATTAAPKPTTTAPKPTTTKAPPVQYADGEIEAIIRSVWPDDLEDKALAIAWRESNHQPRERNFCCYGLFQIYFEVHKKWLADLGVNSAEDLYDPTTNAYAALVLYQRSGGWGPWGG